MSKKRKEFIPSGTVSDEEGPVGVHRIPDVPLRVMFQHLGVRDLLDCRLVNKQWSAVASSVLQTRRTFIDLGKLRRVSAAKDSTYAANVLSAHLDYLSERLQTDKYFPFLGVVISPASWGVTRTAEFCRNFGKFFQRLYLKKVSNEAAVELLGRCFPNVRDLVVDLKGAEEIYGRGRRFRKAGPLALNGENIVLPSLERITIDDWGQGSPYGVGVEAVEDGDLRLADFTFVKAIVEAAPNLKKLDNFHFWLYPCLRACAKLEAITKLSIDYKFFSTRVHYSKFAEHAPALSSIKICNSDYRRRPSLEDEEPHGWNSHRAETECAILAASQSTLKQLAIEKLSGPLPLLAALKSLWILPDDKAAGRHYRIFDTDGPPSTYFPDLERVRICMDMLGSDDVDRYFKYRVGPRSRCLFESVQTLELLGVFDASAFSSLKVIFPNIKILRVHWGYFKKNHRKWIYDLWTCGWDLTELEIYGYHEDRSTLPEFRNFLTGISERTFKSLRGQLNTTEIPVETLRTKPSICNLTRLETFRVFFSGGFWSPTRADEEESETSVPLAYSHALGLMPNLKVIFEYDFRADTGKSIAKTLAPYSSLVRIQHRDEEF